MSTRDQLAGSRRIVQREAARLSRIDAIRTGQELRELRLGLGVPQAEVARVVGVSRSVISELEAGDPSVALEIRRRAAVAVGADLRINVYPGATPLVHDAAHARLVERLLGRRHRRWEAQIEARVPGPGRSSTEVRLEAFGSVVAIEVRHASGRGMRSSVDVRRSGSGSATRSAVGRSSTPSCAYHLPGTTISWSRTLVRP